jgi:hypothetical protein
LYESKAGNEADNEEEEEESLPVIPTVSAMYATKQMVIIVSRKSCWHVVRSYLNTEFGTISR